MTNRNQANTPSPPPPPVDQRSVGVAEAPVFIFGCPRSGTSLISRMLDAHPRLACPFESHLYNTFYPWLKYYSDLSQSGGRRRLVNDILCTQVMRDWTPPPDANRTFDAIKHHDFHGVVDALMTIWTQNADKKRWIEKTPAHGLMWRTIREGFPNMKVIHMVRDGRDVALSTMASRFSTRHILVAAGKWRRYLDEMTQAREALGSDQFMELHYESLVTDAERQLKRICDFLGEAYAPAMLDYHHRKVSYQTDARNNENLNQPIQLANTEKWRTRMSSRDQRLFEAIAGDCLTRYGYPRAAPQAVLKRFESWRCRYLEHPPRKAWAMLRNIKGQKDALRRLGIYLRLRLNPPR